MALLSLDFLTDVLVKLFREVFCRNGCSGNAVNFALGCELIKSVDKPNKILLVVSAYFEG